MGLKKIFQNNIDWQRLRGRDKNDYKIDIKDALISREDRTLYFTISSNFVLDQKERQRLEEAFRHLSLGKVNIEIIYLHEDIVQTDEEALISYLPFALERIRNNCTSLSECIKPNKAELKEGTFYIFTLGKLVAERLNKRTAKALSAIFKEDLAIDCKVCFKNDEEDYREVASALARDTEEEIEQECRRNERQAEEAKKISKERKEKSGTTVRQTGSFSGASRSYRRTGRRKKQDAPARGNIILGGRPIKSPCIDIKDVNAESGMVTVKGIIFSKEAKTTKNGSKIVIIYITDKHTSISLKCFVSTSKWEEMDRLISEGDMIKVYGNAEINNYDHSLDIMVNGMEKLEAEKRTDSYSGKKRVELHCHTKMSALDGLNDPETIVKTAYDWGHKAVAITDHGVVQAFPDAAHCAEKLAGESDDHRRIKLIYGLEGYLLDDKNLKKADGEIDYKKKKTNHIIILAATKRGLINLYKLVSISHLKYFYRKPRIPRSVLDRYREGLILGSACEAGEVYQAIENKLSDADLDRIASYYDYLEIQPISNNKFLIDKGVFSSEEDLKNNNRRIVEAGQRLGIPVVATTDAHFDEPDSAIYRNILQAGQGYSDIGSESANGLYLRTTEEMLDEFSYLGTEKAHEVVIDNSNRIADMISDDITPVPEKNYPPKIEGADEILRSTCMKKAHEIYGDPLPDVIADRLETELSSIIGNGYAVLYVSAQMLVKKSNEDGYLVGSRGSVGSSFAATMAGITEVNPLDPHYICPNCKHLEWGDKSKYDCGVDMPAKKCPVCGEDMNRDGFTIPFATFLGFSGNKEPDIDLNFAGEYQQTAHEYVGKIFGEKNVYKAGTVSTLADKSAVGFVLNYADERNLALSRPETIRLSKGLRGVKKTTGQHPGGIIIVPDDREIFEFCPVQHPANDTSTDIVTTHFDYHKIEKNLLKLDILGHNVPSMIRQLQDMTGVDPLSIDLTDTKVLSIFNGIEALDIKDPDYKFTHGTYAIPEFGTAFVRRMLDDIKPKKFEDLIRISGFSHGTDVWRNNAQDYIRSGTASIDEVISTRDDIMNYLIMKGLEKKDAFQIMEDVRKNRPLKEDQLTEMREHDVPEWYIDSCVKVQYLFPRAHAVAYVLMSFRMAWYKVYYPREFYATYFTQVTEDFDADTILKGQKACLKAIDDINAMGKNASQKDKDKLAVYETAYEMYGRAYYFAKPKLGKSAAKRFRVSDGKILLPYLALEGVGERAALALYEAYEEKAFDTIEEAVNRAKLNKTALDSLRAYGVFDGLPESDQLSFFTMIS